ncbi:hypothetical protein BD410DRAFT_857169 [Rickenella mellea]|uniref:Mixed lineage kinase domain-containing protein n=1 Tax=Rickenella mellea TaxID=50990 RepID=A0A4Y7PIM1_9AGAM|nr:hypothetical protein BD410DRAFT_857169 [Rickenella mellea]
MATTFKFKDWFQLRTFSKIYCRSSRSSLLSFIPPFILDSPAVTGCLVDYECVLFYSNPRNDSSPRIRLLFDRVGAQLRISSCSFTDGAKGKALDEPVMPRCGSNRTSFFPFNDRHSIDALPSVPLPPDQIVSMIPTHYHYHHHHNPMPIRRLSRRASSTPDSLDAKSTESGSSSVVAAARAATPVALTALVQSADVFPPLKSAVSFLLQVHDICEKMKSNREGANELRLRVEGVRGYIVEAFQEEEDMSIELYDALVQFDNALTSILVAVDNVRWRKTRVSRLAFSARDAETLRTVKQRLDDAMKLLMMIVTLLQSKTLRSVSQTVSRVETTFRDKGCKWGSHETVSKEESPTAVIISVNVFALGSINTMCMVSQDSNHGLKPPLGAGGVRVSQTGDSRGYGDDSALESMAVLLIVGEALVYALAIGPRTCGGDDVLDAEIKAV